MEERQRTVHPKSAPIRDDKRGGFLGNLQTMHNEDFYLQRKQKQLQYQQDLDKQVDARRSINGAPGSSMPSSMLQVELREVNLRLEEQQPGNLGRYRKKHEIENHSNFLVNGTHVLGGALQRDEAEILRRKKELQRKEIAEALQKQIEEKNALKQEKQRRELSSAQAAFPIRQSIRSHDISPDFSPVPVKAVPKSFEPVLLFKLEEAIQPEKLQESRDLDRKASSASLPREDETLDYLSQLCQKLIKEQEELKTKVEFQDSVIEQLRKTKTEFPAPKHELSVAAPKTGTPAQRKQPPPSRRNTAQKLKQKEELARISEIEQKIEAARKRADERKNIKAKPEARATLSNLERQVPRRVASSTNSRVPAQPYRVQSALPNLTSEIELPPLLSAKTTEPVQKELSLPQRSDEFTGNSKFIYPNSQGHFDDELDKFMQSQVQSRSPMLQSKFPRDVFTSKRGVGFTPS